MPRTSRPASRSAVAVPPVETSSTPRSASPRAKSTIPVLSETDSSARWMRTSPGWVTGRRPYRSTTTARAGAPGPATRRRARSDAPPRTAARARAGAALADLVGVVASGSSTAALGDDRAGVDALVDEVHGDAEDLDPVGERLLDRADAREGRQQRRVDVDHAVREAREERRRRGAACSRRARPARRRARRASRPSPRRAPRGRGSRRAGRPRVGDARAARRARAPSPPACPSRRRRPRSSRPWTRSRSACRFVPGARGEDADAHAQPPASGSARRWSAACRRRAARRRARGPSSARRWPKVP